MRDRPRSEVFRAAFRVEADDCGIDNRYAFDARRLPNDAWRTLRVNRAAAQ
jgi:hypothetical protein